MLAAELERAQVLPKSHDVGHERRDGTCTTQNSREPATSKKPCDKPWAAAPDDRLTSASRADV